jgi:hypothetical protein
MNKSYSVHGDDSGDDNDMTLYRLYKDEGNYYIIKLIYYFNYYYFHSEGDGDLFLATS